MSVAGQLMDPVARFVQSLVREYLEAEGFGEALRSFNAACDKRGIAAEVGDAWFEMSTRLRVKALKRRFPATEDGVNATTLEVLVRALDSGRGAPSEAPRGGLASQTRQRSPSPGSGQRPSSAFGRTAGVDFDSPVSIHAAKTRRRNLQEEIYDRRSKGEYMPSPSAPATLTGRRLLEDIELSSLLDLERARQDLAAYEGAYAEAAERTIEARRQRTRRLRASMAAAGRSPPQPSAGGGAAAQPSRSSPILSPLRGRTVRRQDTNRVGGAEGGGDGQQQEQQEQGGSPTRSSAARLREEEATANAARLIQHLSLEQLSAMANRAAGLRKADQMQDRARFEAMRFLVGRGAVMRAVRDEMRKEEDVRQAQLRAYREQGRGIHAHMSAGAATPKPAATPATASSSALRPPTVSKARSEVLLERRQKLLGTAVARTKRSKKRREDPAAKEALALLSSEAMLPVSQRARMVRREIAAIRENDHAVRKAKESTFKSVRQSTDLDREKLQERLGKRIRADCALCAHEFATINLPMVVTHKAVNELRASWGHPTSPDSRHASFPACYDSAHVCGFCAQFFETEGPSRIEASRSRAKKQGILKPLHS